MRSFDIPDRYKSKVIGRLKALRSSADPRKQDHTPARLDFGRVVWIVPRHFGFCFGVENAIEIVHKAIEENSGSKGVPGKRVFLLSQMIHNPVVNADLESQGVRFLHDTQGREIVPISELTSDDVVVVPAFGTTVEMEARLASIGLDIARYNTTCPFVERVWKRSAKLGAGNFTVIIHGKPGHEETRATFSHSNVTGHALVVSDRAEAEVLAAIMRGERDDFEEHFAGRGSDGFDPELHLKRIGVVNQTTMLATETQAIADLLNAAADESANTRDTLCYATVDNQKATLAALNFGEVADLALVVGGFNSSNTSHLVELCQKALPTYFISGAQDLISAEQLWHFDLSKGKRVLAEGWAALNPQHTEAIRPLRVILTSGASCPDATVDQVLQRVNQLLDGGRDVDEVFLELA